jgi:hypothetical protein
MPVWVVELRTRTDTVEGVGSTVNVGVGDGEADEDADDDEDGVLPQLLVEEALAELSPRCSTRIHTSPVTRVRATRSTRAGSGRRFSGLVMTRDTLLVCRAIA